LQALRQFGAADQLIPAAARKYWEATATRFALRTLAKAKGQYDAYIFHRG
jgi:hypothetical protein